MDVRHVDGVHSTTYIVGQEQEKMVKPNIEMN